MENSRFQIVDFNNIKHRDKVIDLWRDVFGYEAAHNRPELVIDKKLDTGDGLFFIALEDQQVVGTVMAGYDGHRGWIYSIAVHPDHRKQGIGSKLLAYTQVKLEDLGCLKVNLQIMEGNEEVRKFYLANGYSIEQRISMGKKLYQEK
jgi:ribosomal protein S18 acetylase RimI-like enzyme